MNRNENISFCKHICNSSYVYRAVSAANYTGSPGNSAQIIANNTPNNAQL